MKYKAYRRRDVRSAVVVATCGALVPACGTGVAGDSDSNLIVRDSAGIIIVENVAPIHRDGLPWRLSADPEISIGTANGDPAYQLFGLSGATRLSDGRIAVLNSGTSELRFYDKDGQHIRTVGRQGQGPGEFLRPEHLQRTSGDSLLVWDTELRSVSVFGPAGDFVRQNVLDRARVMSLIGFEHATERLTPLPDRSFVLHVTKRASGPVPRDVVHVPRIGFYRIRHDLSAVDSIGWLSDLPQLLMDIGGRTVGGLLLFPTHATVAAGGRPLRIFTGNGETFEVRVSDMEGHLERIIRRIDPPTPISDEEFEAARRRRLQSPDRQSMLHQYRRVLEAMPRQTTHPAYRDFLVDAEGCLWTHSNHEGWNVFDAVGRWLGSVDMPPIHPIEIGTHYVLGSARGEFDVERVVLFALTRTGNCRS